MITDFGIAPWAAELPRGFDSKYKIGVNEKEHKITVEELPDPFSELIIDECDNCGRKILAYEAAHLVGRPTWLEDLLSNFMIILPSKTEIICHRCWKRENKE